MLRKTVVGPAEIERVSPDKGLAEGAGEMSLFEAKGVFRVAPAPAPSCSPDRGGR